MITVWEGPVLFQHDSAALHKARSIEAWLGEFGMEEVDWPAQSTDLNPIQHLGNELDGRLRARLSRPTSVSDLTNALLDEWATIPTDALQNLVESLHRTVEAIIATEGGGPTPC